MAKKRKNKTSAPAQERGTTPRKDNDEQPQSLGRHVREWSDALVIAFLLAMFIRVFVFELFKIPSPSMTPTLLGTEAPMHVLSFFDVDRDGDDDMILRSWRGRRYDVYENRPERFVYMGQLNPGYAEDSWMRLAQQRQDRILVAKFSYWFHPPDRGDIVVFRTPLSIFEPLKPVYIKRVVGLPGERLTFEPAEGVPGHENSMAHLMVNGERVMEPEFFALQRYEWRGLDMRQVSDDLPYATYRARGGLGDLVEAQVPGDGVYVFGDNTVSSQDSRYWGAVPLDRLRGRAILRIMRNPGFLR